MNIAVQAKRLIHRYIGEPTPKKNPKLLNRKDIVNIGSRAYTKAILYKGQSCLKKSFSTEHSGRVAFRNERLANKLFGKRGWFLQHKQTGIRSFVVERLSDEYRLDKAVQTMDLQQRKKAAAEVLSIILDLLVAGYCHRDIHGGNAFLIDGSIKLVDFETMTKYASEPPGLSNCYDISGVGADSPWMTHQMCYTKKHSLAIGELLGISFEEAKMALSQLLIEELHQASLSFQTTNERGRHQCALGAIYNTIDLPDLKVAPAMAQRDCAKRFRKFGISSESLGNKSVLDLGSNIGGIIFEAVKHSPLSAIGVEYDAAKVHVSNRVAKFSNLGTVRFIQADIDKLKHSTIGGAKDVIFCLAVDGHVKKRNRLYKFLGTATKETLYFEGNSNSDIDLVREKLLANGFRHVELLGMCDDDRRQENNCRPLLRAFKA